MAVFVRKLKKAERLELSRLLHSSEDGRVVRRAQMILQSSHSSPDLTNKVYTNVDSGLRQAVDLIPVDDWL